MLRRKGRRVLAECACGAMLPPRTTVAALVEQARVRGWRLDLATNLVQCPYDRDLFGLADHRPYETDLWGAA
jgi:hypothetical protein